MSDLENSSNNELKGMLKGLEAEHVAVKNKIMRGYEELDQIEREFEKIKSILKKRLNL